MKYFFKSLNGFIATVTGNKVHGVSVGDTQLKVTDENNVPRGTIDVKVINKETQGDVPTGITVTPTSVALTSIVDNTKLLKVTIIPDTATNKNVIWSSSDKSVATVSSTGKVVANSKTGTAIITAKASGNDSVTATCNVSVKLEGTFINGVTPSTVVITDMGLDKDTGELAEFKVSKTDENGYYSGYSGYGTSVGTTIINSEDNTKFVQAFPANWGTEREITLNVRGKNTGDNGVNVTVRQEACKVAKGFQNGSSRTLAGHPSSERVVIWDNVKFYAADNISTARSIVNSATITDRSGDGGNAVSWCWFGNSEGGSSVNVVRYGSTSGGVATWGCDLICDENNTGSSRKAYAHFPTYIYNSTNNTYSYSDGGLVLTITQNA